MIKGFGITKSFGKQKVLDRLDIEVEESEMIALLGENGSGKSTLLDILALAVKPDEGTIMIDGWDSGRNTSRLRKGIGYVPQDIALFQELTVNDNLMCWSPRRKQETRQRIQELEPYLGLSEISGKKVSALSGGMKRRVNLAVALLGSPDYLLLDEPLSGLDSGYTRRVLDLLKDMRSRGCGILITGHQSPEIISMADRVLKLSGGALA